MRDTVIKEVYEDFWLILPRSKRGELAEHLQVISDAAGGATVLKGDGLWGNLSEPVYKFEWVTYNQAQAAKVIEGIKWCTQCALRSGESAVLSSIGLYSAGGE